MLKLQILLIWPNSEFYTVYAVHMANIKFGKLECNANWRVFSLVNRANKTDKRNRLTIISVGGHKIWQLN